MTYLSPEAWGEWKTHPCTIEFLDGITVKRDERKEHLGAGGALNTDSADSTALQYARGVGYCEALQELMDEIEEEGEEQ